MTDLPNLRQILQVSADLLRGAVSFKRLLDSLASIPIVEPCPLDRPISSAV